MESVHTAKNVYAKIASADVLSVKNYAVNHVLKKAFVQTVKKKMVLHLNMISIKAS